MLITITNVERHEILVFDVEVVKVGHELNKIDNDSFVNDIQYVEVYNVYKTMEDPEPRYSNFKPINDVY